MATRFYLSSTTVAHREPGFAGWTRTTEGARRRMSPQKDGSTIQSTTFWANGAAAANESALARQFVSDAMAAGIAFVTTDTIKCQVLCRESAVNDNINRQPITVKVYSEDGQTLRATMLALAHIGPNTTEWLNTGPRNKIVADGDVLTTGYTTVAGDRLVIELGGQVSSAAGTSVTGTQWYGADGASDLGENETDTNTALNAWFEISRTVTFLDPDFTTQQNQFPDIKPPVTPPIAVGLTVAAGLLLTTLAPTPPTLRAPFYAGRQPLPIVQQVDPPPNLLPLLLGGEAPAPFRQQDWPNAFPITPTIPTEWINSPLWRFDECPAGPYFGTSAVNNTADGDTPWSNLTNALNSDDSYATCVLTNTVSHNLWVSGFNFNISPAKVISGVKVEVEGKTLSGDVSMRIRVSGDDFSNQEVDVWNTTETFRTYGGPTELWGLNWTPAKINASSFGAVVSTFSATDTVSVDSVRITVYCADQIFSQKLDWPNVPKLPTFLLATDAPNLLANTLAPTGDKPFGQPDWSQLRPQALQTTDAPLNLLGTTLAPAVGEKPFAQTDWPNFPAILPSKAPQHSSYRLSFGAPAAGDKPFLQNDWPKLQQLPDLYQVLEILNLALGTIPFRQDHWPNLPKGERPRIENPPNLLTTTLAEAPAPLPFNQNDWPTLKLIRPLHTLDPLNVTILLPPGPVPFIPVDWPLPKKEISLPVFDALNLTIQLPVEAAAPFAQLQWSLLWIVQKAPQSDAPNLLLTTLAPVVAAPFNQQQWNLPAALTLFAPTAIEQRLLTLVPPPGPAPFSQADWPLPPPLDKSKLGVFMLTENVVLLTTPPPPVATGSREKRKWRRSST